MRPFLILLLLLPSLAAAQTDVSGDQSGTWTSANSPYRVVGDVTIPSGQTLNIGPGVEINFQGHYKLTVLGDLQAIGAGDSMIVFTTDDTSTGWAGIRVDTANTIELAYCRFEYGYATGDYPDGHGGAIALLTSDAVVRNCIFADNKTGTNGNGGAIYAYNTSVTTISDSTFSHNSCYGEGGAVDFIGDIDGRVTNCTFIENHCDYGGGAISFYSAAGTIIKGCIFGDNYTNYSNGGAIQALGIGTTIYVANCTFNGNSAVTGDGGAANLAYTQASIVNTIAWNNPGAYSNNVNVDVGSTVDISYSNMTMPSGATGTNNIDADPKFVDAVNHDYHLQATSPCIDSGVASYAAGAVVLVDLTSSQYDGSAPDIGALEYGAIFNDNFESGGMMAWSWNSDT